MKIKNLKTKILVGIVLLNLVFNILNFTVYKVTSKRIGKCLYMLAEHIDELYYITGLESI